MHYLDHLLECPIGPSLKVLQLRRLFDWTNMAAALPQFFGAARHPCFEVSGNASLVDLALNEIARNFALTAHYQIRCGLPGMFTRIVMWKNWNKSSTVQPG